MGMGKRLERSGQKEAQRKKNVFERDENLYLDGCTRRLCTVEALYLASA